MTEALDPEIESPEQLQALEHRRDLELADFFDLELGVDIAKAARDPGESLAIVRGYAAYTVKNSGDKKERMAAAMLLLNSVPECERKAKDERKPRALPQGDVDLYGRPVKSA